MSRAPAGLTLALAFVCSALPAQALEGDQYYAWGRSLEDSADALNARIQLTIERELERINAAANGRQLGCEQVVDRLAPRFKQFIFQDIEIWLLHSSFVDRIPATEEEDRSYRDRFLYRDTHLFDIGTKVPPSLTIEIDGIRVGTDKLSHFFSEGAWYYKWYRNRMRPGADREQVLDGIVRRGALWERTILGLLASGVFSVGDMEANYQGMRFFVELCEGDSPGLTATDEGWRTARRFEIREYVTPSWDESYVPASFGRRRWKKVRPVLLEYCPLLHDPWVVAQRARYRKRDRPSRTLRVIEALVDEGKLKDPWLFSLDANCREAQER